MSIPGIIEEKAKKIDGYKTQISLLIACVLYILKCEGIWIAPEWVWPIVALIFGSSVRSTIKKFENHK